MLVVFVIVEYEVTHFLLLHHLMVDNHKSPVFSVSLLSLCYYYSYQLELRSFDWLKLSVGYHLSPSAPKQICSIIFSSSEKGPSVSKTLNSAFS